MGNCSKCSAYLGPDKSGWCDRCAPGEIAKFKPIAQRAMKYHGTGLWLTWSIATLLFSVEVLREEGAQDVGQILITVGIILFLSFCLL